MVRPLRKYHFVIWRVFAMVLPLGFTMALVLRPASPRYVHSEKDFEFKVVEKQTVTHVSIDVLNPIDAASCVVFGYSSAGKKYLLGSINNIGHYSFPCTDTVISVALFDPIRDKEIITHQFSK